MNFPIEHDTLIDRVPELGERWGQYVLEERVASGGMADVFRARRVGAASFTRQVCLKRMHGHLSVDPEMVTLFLDEALIGSKLRHRNIVSVEDLGEHEGRYFLAMEYVNGLDLRRIEKRAAMAKHPVPGDVAMYIANEVLTALHAAHTALDPDTHRGMNVVHRDISPQNVLVAYSGQVKLADFGVACADGRKRVTESRSICGKVGYMPIEQAAGARVDARADLFALGVTLFELLAGRRPFVGDRVRPSREEVIAAMVQNERPALRDLRPDVAPALAKLIDAMLVTSPENRLPSALAGLEMIERSPERARGGRALIEWLAALYPGHSSIANMARVAVSTPPLLATPRPAATTAAITMNIRTPQIAHSTPAADPVTRRARVRFTTDDALAPTRLSSPAVLRAGGPPSHTVLPVATQLRASRLSMNPPRTSFAAIAALIVLGSVAFVSAAAVTRTRTIHAAAHLPSIAFSIARVSPSASIAPIATPAPPAPITPVAHPSREAPVTHARSNVARRAPPVVAQPAMGSIRVVVLPWGDVEIDGHAVGRAPVTAAVEPGMHRVRIWGGVMRTAQVEVRSGEVSVLALEEP